MKTILIIFFIFLMMSISTEGSEMKITNLRCEYKVNPIGMDIKKPRFSWIMESKHRGSMQTAYQLLVSSSLEKLNDNNGDLWDSEKVKSDNSIQKFYEGSELKSNDKYYWKVTVWDQENKAHSSKPAFWTTGLLNESDWKAKWIGLDKAVGNDNPNDPHRKLNTRMLRKEINTDKKIKSAMAFISGLGLFEFYVNGEKIGDQVLAPGLTEYNKRTFYNTFDITANLHQEGNAIGVILGNGRYFAPRTNEPTKTRTYGFPKVLCQLEIEYEDGTTEIVITDETWKLTTDGPTRFNNEYDGELYDARMELTGWSQNNYDDSNWLNAEVVDKPGKKLVSQPNESIKIMEELTPISVNEIKQGVFIFDMGQNMVGWVELFVNGNKGDTVSLRFAETINDDGSLSLDNIRGAEVTDTYILKGEGEEKWEPKFTYHGFRFVEMIGYPGVPDLASIKGKVVHDALDISGTFTCSNPMINNIYKNAYWGIRGNYRSIPTDCPQRDERQGWLGDRSAECTGESFIFDLSNLYNKWLVDIQDAQQDGGSIPDVAPSYWPIYSDNTTWPGTYIFASEMLYNQYGDLKTIETHYPYMQKWIEYMSQFLRNDIMPKDTYGDWCVPPEDLKLIHTNDPLRTTTSEFIGTAYFYYELKLMEKFAKLLGKESDGLKYSESANKMKKAFNNKFLDLNSIQYSNNSHTANILALAFNLVPSERKERIVNNLLQKILGASDSHVGNGIVGGQWLMRTLTENGHADVAYTLASQRSYPSWGYMVDQGATTIWELWNGDHGDPGMNSGNHVMLLGDLIIWFYENLAGIKTDPELTAFKKIIMKPQVLGDLKFVTASYNSIYGKIKSVWKIKDGKFNWDITIPANTTALIYVPTLNMEEVIEGDKLALNSDNVSFIGWDDYWAKFEIGSGEYSFSSNGVKKKITQTYLSTPIISQKDTTVFIGDKIVTSISCKNDKAVIRYTIDGTEPNNLSQIYNKPLEITHHTIIKAQAFQKNYNSSLQAKAIYDFVDSGKNGIVWNLYEGAFKKLPNFNELKSVGNGKVYQFGLDNINLPKHNFAIQFKSLIQIERDGDYEFFLSSNDGSKLYLDDTLVVDNDGEHAPKQLSGSKYLTKGKHSIIVDYFQSGGTKVVLLAYSSDHISYQSIPGNILFQNNDK